MWVRIAICIFLPFIVAYAVVARLVREARSAVRYAYWDAAEEIAAARKAWRAKSIDRDFWEIK
ncbi:hypothetical protein C3941_19545 [Kaistia algarum]|uniref:hypothetical protein n=1 Tax=Kaistia algarum TaxID=2083279 RepID=UPI000CE7847F|nr:hypothetical protein [Kaistia algarum]MCX5516187.1 hypothetical protein [Kaistia algarum]PPE78261.1 hypothetical protein C3941_19545 [Kaistia algarum]